MNKDQCALSGVVAAVALGAVLVWSALAHAAWFLHPQIATAGTVWDMGEVTIRNIRQVENVATLKGKPGIEIELHNTQRFHIGELDWCLRIGELDLGWPILRSADHHLLTWVLDLNDWKNLKDGAPLYPTWGCYDAKQKGVQPFTHLNKKIPRKTRQSSTAGDVLNFALTPRFRPIDKSAG